jgi:hypothetical protein
MRIALLFVFVVLSASAQTNVTSANPLSVSNSPAGTVQVQTNQMLSVKDRLEKIRMEVIQKRRMICGRIVKIMPDGLVVDSGYTNLMRAPLNLQWLMPGTVVAERATNLVEANQPDAICVGLVFVTDLPKSRGVKPALYDYVNLEGFPVGEYTYTSVGTIQRTVREFSNKLEKATLWNFDQTEPQNAPPK